MHTQKALFKATSKTPACTMLTVQNIVGTLSDTSRCALNDSRTGRLSSWGIARKKPVRHLTNLWKTSSAFGMVHGAGATARLLFFDNTRKNRRLAILGNVCFYIISSVPETITDAFLHGSLVYRLGKMQTSFQPSNKCS
jgi:hypothetical protein